MIYSSAAMSVTIDIREVTPLDRGVYWRI